MTTTTNRTSHNTVKVVRCPEHQKTRISKEYLTQQSVYPVKPGSKTEAWFKPFLNHFMIISGIVTSNRSFIKTSEHGPDRPLHLITLVTAQVENVETEVSSVIDFTQDTRSIEDDDGNATIWIGHSYAPLREEVRIVTRHDFMEGNLIFLQVMPYETEYGLQVAHDSVTMGTAAVLHELKKRLVALLASIEWTDQNLHQLVQDFDSVGREIFNQQPFWFYDRKKMHTWPTALERLDGLKQIADYSSALMRILQKDGPEQCAAKILKVKKGDPRPLYSFGQEYFDLLEADDQRRVKVLEAGPYLKKDNPPLWNTPEFNEG